MTVLPSIGGGGGESGNGSNDLADELHSIAHHEEAVNERTDAHNEKHLVGARYMKAHTSHVIGRYESAARLQHTGEWGEPVPARDGAGGAGRGGGVCLLVPGATRASGC